MEVPWPTRNPGRSLLGPAVLVGIGVAGSLDEIVLHQLLRWHHFYDRGSQAAGLIADGLFHLGSTAALVIGLVLLVQRWRTGRGPLRPGAGGADRRDRRGGGGRAGRRAVERVRSYRRLGQQRLGLLPRRIVEGRTPGHRGRSGCPRIWLDGNRRAIPSGATPPAAPPRPEAARSTAETGGRAWRLGQPRAAVDQPDDSHDTPCGRGRVARKRRGRQERPRAARRDGLRPSELA